MKNSALCAMCELWMDGELNPSEQAAFEDHMQDCPQCAERGESWKSLKLDLEAAARLFGPNNNEHQVSISPRVHSTAASKSYRSKGWLTLGICCLVLVSIGVYPLFMNPETSSTSAKFDGGTTLPGTGTPEMALNSKPVIPVVTVEIKAPAIASTPISSPKFTVVQVYPVFQVRD